MAVFAPIPSARVRTAIVVKPGFLKSWRRAKRMAFDSKGRMQLACQQRNQAILAVKGRRADQNWDLRFQVRDECRAETPDWLSPRIRGDGFAFVPDREWRARNRGWGGGGTYAIEWNNVKERGKSGISRKAA